MKKLSNTEPEFKKSVAYKKACKCYLTTTPKSNHPKGIIYACKYFIKTKTVDQKMKTKVNFISFSPH